MTHGLCCMMRCLLKMMKLYDYLIYTRGHIKHRNNAISMLRQDETDVERIQILIPSFCGKEALICAIY